MDGGTLKTECRPSTPVPPWGISVTVALAARGVQRLFTTNQERAMTTATRSEIRWEARPTAGHDRHGQSSVYDSETGKDIAIVYDGAAHGDLIAAAPELLEACEVAAVELDRAIRSGLLGSTWTGVQVRLADAIAKAEGR
jgi:hypothetical protein